MSWVKLDDAILDNPKIIAAGPLGFALHVAAITWCARNLSDGLIPKRRVALLLDLPSLQVSETTKMRVLHALTPDDLAADMARIGLWHDRGERWEVHDYLVYNPSRAQVLARRAGTRKRVKKHRGLACNAVTNAHVTPPPVPVPVPGSQKKTEQEDLPLASLASRARVKKAHRVPEAETLTDPRRADAIRLGIAADEIDALWAEFCDVEFKTARSDWSATWRNSCRRAVERHAMQTRAPDDRDRLIAEVRRRMEAK